MLAQALELTRSVDGPSFHRNPPLSVLRSGSVPDRGRFCATASRLQWPSFPGVCPSGQRERAVNPSAQPTEVRILPPPLMCLGGRIGVAPEQLGATLGKMPTTKPRYTFTDTGDLEALLDAAGRRWPEISDRKALLL